MNASELRLAKAPLSGLSRQPPHPQPLYLAKYQAANRTDTSPGCQVNIGLSSNDVTLHILVWYILPSATSTLKKVSPNLNNQLCEPLPDSSAQIESISGFLHNTFVQDSLAATLIAVYSDIRGKFMSSCSNDLGPIPDDW